MKGKRCVITGATSGIGFAAARALAAKGAMLALVGRDPARGKRALAELRSAVPGAAMALHIADLARLSEIRRLAGELRAAYPRIDILVNNAGAIFHKRLLTEDGLERTFALNHMGYFLLTQLLRDSLIAAAPARIVNVASRAHRDAELDLDDLNLERSFTGWRAYQRSKLANILFTRELAHRLVGTGVTANCLHPGFVASRFGDNNGVLFRWGIGVAKLFAITPAKGAETVVHLAASPEVAAITGGYFANSAPATPSSAAQNDETARRLWAASARIAGLQ